MLFLGGKKSSQTINKVTQFLKLIKKDEARVLYKKNEILPFDNSEDLIFLCEKNITPLFCFSKSSKKRPNSLIFGRIFEA